MPLSGIICLITSNMTAHIWPTQPNESSHPTTPIHLSDLIQASQTKLEAFALLAVWLSFTQTNAPTATLLGWKKFPLRKIYWRLSDVWNSTCPNTNLWLPPMEVIQITSPLIISSCCMLIRLLCCVRAMFAHFWRLQLSRNLRYTSSSVSQFTRSVSPQRCWKAKLTPLKQSFGSLWIITHLWGGSVRGLNQSASDTARARVAGVNGGNENSVRWAEDRGLTALFVFFWAVCFVWCYLEAVYFESFDWWFGLLRSFVVV